MKDLKSPRRRDSRYMRPLHALHAQCALSVLHTHAQVQRTLLEMALCMYIFDCLISQSRINKFLLLKVDYSPQATDCLSENRGTEDV